MKIPTLLAITLIISALVVGVTLFISNQTSNNQKNIYYPIDLKVVNITPTQATLVWQTNLPVTSEVRFGSTQILDKKVIDDRDKDQPKKRLTHFMTLTDLSPNTTYFAKVKNDGLEFPNQFLEFKTTSFLEQTNESNLNLAIQGAVLDGNLQPIDEALVSLKIPGASEIVGYTTTAGNFIIPLSNVYKDDYSQIFLFDKPVESELIITRGETKSTLNIISPSTIPTIVLGQNLDLRQLLASNSGNIKPSIFNQNTTLNQVKKFDLNNDSKVNVLDASILLDSFNNRNSRNINKAADLNSDGIVNQADLSILKQALE